MDSNGTKLPLLSCESTSIERRTTYRDWVTRWIFLGLIITINVPLFKKLRDIIIFLRDNNFLSHFEGHFEGAKTFLTP
jgi:hypothetical protein